MKTVTVSWFSAGVSSAVATKLLINEIDHILYQHIDDQEADTLRFVADCEKWFGKKIAIQQSPVKCVEAVCRSVGFVSSPSGAPCTGILKKSLRHAWEAEHTFFNRFRYIWGLDATPRERLRAEHIKKNMIEAEHVFPLIDAGLTKPEIHGILHKAGIRRPRMYDLGYQNNNCVGCVKGGKGYWNKIRMDFPSVFASRVKMERDLEATCIKGVYLDSLDPSAGRNEPPISEECGAMCESADLLGPQEKRP